MSATVTVTANVNTSASWDSNQWLAALSGTIMQPDMCMIEGNCNFCYSVMLPKEEVEGKLKGWGTS